MSEAIVQLGLLNERDVVQARQRAREIAAELGLDNQDQIRLATATSEMARNAFRYARNGRVVEQHLRRIEHPDGLGHLPQQRMSHFQNWSDCHAANDTYSAADTAMSERRCQRSMLSPEFMTPVVSPTKTRSRAGSTQNRVLPWPL